jgi:hypothetical protein
MTDWLARLQPGGVPIFRHTREALARLAPRREAVTAREIALEVLMDPFATLQSIHAISEKMGQRHGTEVTTVEHALMMQGIGIYLDTSQRLPVLEDTAAGRDPKALAALHGLARRAQHAAWQARDFAVLHSDIHAEEIQVAALLHHIPEMLLWLRVPDAARELNRRRRKAASVQEGEAAVLGMPLQTFRPRLLEAWSIPELTRDLLDEKYADRSRQIILRACLAIAEHSERGWWDESLMEHYLALAGAENTPIEMVIATAHGNAARAARSCDWLPVPAAATWGPMIPGPWPVEEEDEEIPSAGKTKAAAAPAETASQPARADRSSASAPAGAPDHAVCPMPDKAIFRESLKGIESHLDGSLTLNQMSAVILKGLHTGLGLSRILFAMVTPDGERVKMRFSLGIPPEDPLRHFEFALSGKDLFGQLMGKMQGVWINEGNRERLWPMVDPKLQKLIGAGDFYAMSLFSGNKPMGLIYADRGHGECGLDPLTYTDFKMLCLQAARGMGKVRN